MLWPGFLEHSRPIRTLAYLDSSRRIIVTEHGDEVPANDWGEIRDALFSRNLILYSERLLDVGFQGAISDPRTRVNATKLGNISSISCRASDGRVRSLVDSYSWGELANFELLGRLRRLFRYVGVGDRTTPSALGVALMREQWQVHNLPWHWSPPLVTQTLLREWSAGPRTETPHKSRSYRYAHEYDITDAFASHFSRLPCGQTLTILDHEIDWKEIATWFRFCHVSLPDELSLSPVPVRSGMGAQWEYPTEGDFCAWLWKEQADSAVEIGASVIPSRGFGWLRMSDDMAHWCELVTRLKYGAASDLVDFVKLAIVAAIGRHAMQPKHYEVIGYYDPDPDGECRPLFGGSGQPFTPFYLRMKQVRGGSMIHWQRYSVMLTNQSLFRVASAAWAGSLIQTNFDSVLLSHELAEVPAGWKHEIHSNVRTPYARAFQSDQKTRTPGIRKADRMKHGTGPLPIPNFNSGK